MEPTLQNKALVLLYLMQMGMPPQWRVPLGQVKALAFLTGADELECERAFVENATEGLIHIEV